MSLPTGPIAGVYLFLLVLHVAAGFIGMYGGLVPVLTRKGGKAHRKWGTIFTWAMGIAAVTAFPLAGIRADLFQAAVGLFSGYLTLYGYRVLRRYGQGSSALWDKIAALVSGATFLAMTVAAGYLMLTRPVPEAKASLVFGILGLVIVGRDIQGQTIRDPSFSRRIIDHLIASTLALVTAFSAFLNTQFYRLTHVDWPLDGKMLLPFAVALPLFVYWLPVWIKRLRTQTNVADISRASGKEASELERTRALGILEGISFLVLLGIAVPLKHIGGHPEFVRIMGSVHGALFVLYSVSVLVTGRSLRWPFPRVLLAIGAGVLPLGTFVLEAKWRREGL